MGVAKAALLLLEEGGRFLLFSNLTFFWTAHLVKSSSHLNFLIFSGLWYMIGNVPTTKREPSHLVMFWKPRWAFMLVTKKQKTNSSSLLDCNWNSDRNHWKDNRNATPGERATPHRGSHPAPPIMKRGETSQLHLFIFRCGGRIPRSILMQLPPKLKVLVV